MALGKWAWTCPLCGVEGDCESGRRRVVDIRLGNAMPPLVYAAEYDDAEQIRLLMRRVIAASIDPSLQRGIIANVEANLTAWLNRSVECVHLVAVSDRSIVGVVLVKNFWNLCSLFVEQAEQGRGVGPRACRGCRSCLRLA